VLDHPIGQFAWGPGTARIPVHHGSPPTAATNEGSDPAAVAPRAFAHAVHLSNVS